jgi:hypothetical protein
MNLITKNNKYNLVFNLIIFVLIVLGCDGSTNISGKVVDESGKPIVNAKVNLKIGTEIKNTETKTDGSYTIFETHAPFKMTYKLTVTKEGFQTYEQTFDSKEELGYKRDIILKK